MAAFARYWAEHLTTDFRHSAWSEIEDFANANGYDATQLGDNENITTADSVQTIKQKPSIRAMELFMNSEGHRYTLLNTEYTRVGVGFAVGPTGRIYCCQEFAR